SRRVLPGRGSRLYLAHTPSPSQAPCEVSALRSDGQARRPVLHREQPVAEDGRGQGSGAQEAAEGEFEGGRVLAGELDVAEADHRAGEGSQDQGDPGAAQAEEAAHHGDQLDIAEAEALAMADLEI